MAKLQAKVIRGNPIIKAESVTALSEEEKEFVFESVIGPKYSLRRLYEMREQSTILPQCIDAYKQNIVGFGYELKYRNDETVQEETPEMKAEWELVEKILKRMNMEKPLGNLLQEAIADRESCGNGYLEVIRDGAGRVVGLESVPEPYTIRVTKKETRPVMAEYYRDGEKIERERKFRSYVQIIEGRRTVWFKEFGDRRQMDWQTGKYGENIPLDRQANELIHLKVGSGAYGWPRWISATVDMFGSRSASELNYLYFRQGRHLPAAILIKNGRLTAESEAALSEYANSIEGQSGAHKFLLIEAEALEGETQVAGLEKDKASVDIEIVKLADILQRDGMFTSYDDGNRKKVQSHFRLPDLYVGYTKDFNRATAEMAITITEQQVFIPERKALSFFITNLLLAEYELKYVDVELKGPDISNPADVAAALGTINSIGALAINDVRDFTGSILGKKLENFNDERADLPTALLNQAPPLDMEFLMKSSGAGNSEKIYAVLKDLRALLKEQMKHESP